jgi:hypothetical protein
MALFFFAANYRVACFRGASLPEKLTIQPLQKFPENVSAFNAA